MINALDIPPSQIIWLAGILEGEGSFQIDKHKYPMLRLSMAVDQADTVKRVAELWGKPVRWERPYKTNKQWKRVTAVIGRDAFFWLTLIYPYMSARRKQQIMDMLVTWVRSGAKLQHGQEIKKAGCDSEPPHYIRPGGGGADSTNGALGAHSNSETRQTAFQGIR
jgi:hypothetical protein